MPKHCTNSPWAFYTTTLGVEEINFDNELGQLSFENRISFLTLVGEYYLFYSFILCTRNGFTPIFFSV